MYRHWKTSEDINSQSLVFMTVAKRSTIFFFFAFMSLKLNCTKTHEIKNKSSLFEMQSHEENKTHKNYIFRIPCNTTSAVVVAKDKLVVY